MKRTIFLAALVFMVMAGCTKNEVHEVYDEAPIAFSTIVGNLHTKALIDGTAYSADVEENKFRTSAFMTNGDFDANVDNAGTYIDEQEVSFQVKDGKKYWSTATPYYWPQNSNLKLTFFSYHPSSLVSSASITASAGVTLTNHDVAENQGIDFMVADRITAQSNGTKIGEWENGVATVFHHKLSQIVEFKILADKEYYHESRQVGDIELEVKKISINGIFTKGTYTSGNDVGTAEGETGSWTNQSEAESFTWYENSTGTLLTQNAQNFDKSTGNNYLLVLPQDFTSNDSATITVEYDLIEYYTATDKTTTPKTVTGKLNEIHTDKKFNMNKKISYMITLSAGQNQIYWAPSVADWGTESHTKEL